MQICRDRDQCRRFFPIFRSLCRCRSQEPIPRWLSTFFDEDKDDVTFDHKRFSKFSKFDSEFVVFWTCQMTKFLMLAWSPIHQDDNALIFVRIASEDPPWGILEVSFTFAKICCCCSFLKRDLQYRHLVKQVLFLNQNLFSFAFSLRFFRMECYATH